MCTVQVPILMHRDGVRRGPLGTKVRPPLQSVLINHGGVYKPVLAAREADGRATEGLAAFPARGLSRFQKRTARPFTYGRIVCAQFMH